jgi:hypothetical protein
VILPGQLLLPNDSVARMSERTFAISGYGSSSDEPLIPDIASLIRATVPRGCALRALRQAEWGRAVRVGDDDRGRQHRLIVRKRYVEALDHGREHQHRFG